MAWHTRDGPFVEGASARRSSHRHGGRGLWSDPHAEAAARGEKIRAHQLALVADGKDSSRSALSGLLLVLGSIGGVALLVWLTLVMLDLKHLNTSGFTLP